MLVVTIAGPSRTDVETQIKRAEAWADVIELRADLFDFSDLSNIRSNKKLMLTAYQNEAQLNQVKVDYVDSPIFEDIRSKFPSIKWIYSWHDFEKTPLNLDEILTEMKKKRADFYKIAALAHSTNDALRMLQFVINNKDVTGICMGEVGQVSRILGAKYGSVMNYCCLDEPIAPGQTPADSVLPVDADTQVYGLIGDPICYSQSHLTHNNHFQQMGINAVYVKMRLQADELDLFFELVQELDFRGLSVTMPLKKEVGRFCKNDIDVCNTLKFNKDSIIGCNTDGLGALAALMKHTDIQGKRIAILGAGATAISISDAAKNLGCVVKIFNRTPRAGVLPLNEFPCEYDILIHATSVGMGTDEMLISPEKLLPGKVVLDVVSNPEQTALLRAAKNAGCMTVTGKEMFWQQALLQFDYWLSPYVVPALHQ